VEVIHKNPKVKKLFAMYIQHINKICLDYSLFSHKSLAFGFHETIQCTYIFRCTDPAQSISRKALSRIYHG
jgi:hypothetical protein